jgi:ATP-dependent helicase/nuclease subunit B
LDLRTDRLGDLDDPASRASMAHVLDSSIGRLRRAGVGPSHLRGMEAPQAALLADAMDRVDEILTGARLVDPRGAGLLLGRRLRSAGRIAPGASRGRSGMAPPGRPFPSLPAGVSVKGMAAWEADDLAWLEALHARMRAEHGRGATLVLPRLAEGDEAFGPIADVLERRWAALPDAPEIDWQPAGASAPVEVIRARSPEAEARAAASACLSALSRGTPPERIAILVPELDEVVLEPLRAALADARITFTEPVGRPLAASPEARATLILLDIAEGPVTREGVTDLLRSPGLDGRFWTERLREWTEEVEDAGRVSVRRASATATARATSIAHRLREVPVEIDRTGRLLIEGLASVVKHRAEDAWMTHGLSRLMQRAQWLAEGKTWAEIARRYAALIEEIGLGKPQLRELGAALRTEARGSGGLALRAMADGAVSVLALRDLVKAIARAALALRLEERPSSAGELKMEIERASAGLGILPRGSSTRAAAVRIARPADLCGLEHDVAIVMCLQAHAYSGAASADDALLDERLRSELPAPLRPASSRDREAWQRAELAWTLAGARDIVLSFAPGEESELAEPHPMVVWALRKGARRREEPASRISRYASKLNRRAAELIALAAGATPDAGVAERAAIEGERTAFFYDPDAPPGAFTGKIALGDEASRQDLRARVGGAAPEQTIAVTQIERAAECAFAGFARRVLRARRVEDLAESSDPRERGTLVHRALHAAFDALRSIGYQGDPVRLLLVARSAAEGELGAGRAMTPLRRESIDRAVEGAVIVVARSIEAGDPVRFAFAERRFGPSEGAPWGALELLGSEEDGGPSVFVDGQIDRIDRSTDGRVARVIDYKSNLPTAVERKRGAFQLPLYAAVARRALGAEEVHRLYVAVRKRGDIEEWPRTAADQRLSAEEIEEAVREARRVVLALWEGDVKPRPARATLCDKCDARDICRRPAVVPDDAPEDTA